MSEVNLNGLAWNISIARADRIFRNTVERGTGVPAIDTAQFKTDTKKLILGERVTNLSKTVFRLTETEKAALAEPVSSRKRYLKCGVICSESGSPGYRTTGALQGLKTGVTVDHIKEFFTTYSNVRRTGFAHPDVVTATILSQEE